MPLEPDTRFVALRGGHGNAHICWSTEPPRALSVAGLGYGGIQWVKAEYQKHKVDCSKAQAQLGLSFLPLEQVGTLKHVGCRPR